jgi:predicted phage-related endonuclease
MSETELVQGSEEWRLARVGSLGGSRMQEAIVRTKTGYGASRANLMAELICERLTGQPADKFITQAMQHGTDTEPEGRNAYAFYSGNTVDQVGLIRHPTIEGSHVSPDGLIGEAGGLELKCPQPAAHLETLLGQEIPVRYLTQMMWLMAVTGRQWCDYASYNPSFPEHMRLFVRRVKRDEARIIELETEAAAFLKELAAKLAQLDSLYGEQAAA